MKNRTVTPHPLVLLSAVASLLLIGIKVTDAQSINTIPFWNGSSAISPWGPFPSNSTFGETFQAPASTPDLTAITFEIVNGSPGHPSINYVAQVYEWNGSSAVGAALFTSSMQTVVNSAAYQAITIATGEVALTLGRNYVALFTTIGQPNVPDASNPNGTGWGYLSANGLSFNPIPTSRFVGNSGNTFASLQPGGASWFVPDNLTLAFRLDFNNAVGAPDNGTSLLLLLIGIAGLFAFHCDASRISRQVSRYARPSGRDAR